MSMIVLLEDKEGNRYPIEAVLIAVHSSLIRNILKYEGVEEHVQLPEMEIRITKVIKLPIQSPVLARIIFLT